MPKCDIFFMKGSNHITRNWDTIDPKVSMPIHLDIGPVCNEFIKKQREKEDFFNSGFFFRRDGQLRKKMKRRKKKKKTKEIIWNLRRDLLIIGITLMKITH